MKLFFNLKSLLNKKNSNQIESVDLINPIDNLSSNHSHDEEEIDDFLAMELWLKDMGIESYEIDEHLLINVHGNVNLKNKNLTQLPFKFGSIEGYFDISHNQLMSDYGFPYEVKKYFDCSYNQLEKIYSMDVKKHANISHNQIKSLAHIEIETSSLDCSYNQLINLDGVREKMTYLNCSHNQIISLKNSPQFIATLDCSYNQLTNLEGIALDIYETLNCSYNKINTLDYLPNSINYTFDISYNPLSIHSFLNVKKFFTNCFIFSVIEFTENNYQAKTLLEKLIKKEQYSIQFSYEKVTIFTEYSLLDSFFEIFQIQAEKNQLHKITSQSENDHIHEKKKLKI